MSYRIAGIDVHKKVLAVVVSNVEIEGEYQFERCQFGSNPGHLRLLSEWLIEQQVEEVVMESRHRFGAAHQASLRSWRTRMSNSNSPLSREGG